jgi:Recombination endonuclease VII
MLDGVRHRDAARRIERVYGLSEQEYAALLRHQQGRCWCCRRATGASKRLAVDHDHSCDRGHPSSEGCRQCVRGLLCGVCNRLVGFLRDDPETFERMADYLREPPAREVLR